MDKEKKNAIATAARMARKYSMKQELKRRKKKSNKDWTKQIQAMDVDAPVAKISAVKTKIKPRFEDGGKITVKKKKSVVRKNSPLGQKKADAAARKAAKAGFEKRYEKGGKVRVPSKKYIAAQQKKNKEKDRRRELY